MPVTLGSAASAVGSSGLSAGLAATGGWTGAALSSLGAITSGMGSFLKSNYASSAQNYNAQMLQREAAQTRGAAAVKSFQEGAASAREIASGNALYGASGVDLGSGSPLSVLHENIRNAQASAMETRVTGNLKANALDEEAQALKNQARQSQAGGLLDLGTSFLGSATKSVLQQYGGSNP